jgi:hypothetical protein
LELESVRIFMTSEAIRWPSSDIISSRRNKKPKFRRF